MLSTHISPVVFANKYNICKAIKVSNNVGRTCQINLVYTNLNDNINILLCRSIVYS
jgi:hypothetical protein